jgi:tRNA1Val (adenine37-N6)-methyltransferase
MIERIDDLQINNLKIIQNPNLFCFGLDAVLLANYIKGKGNSKAEVLDIGTGNGIIPILLTAKIKFRHIDAVEIQKKISDMARRSIQLNNLESSIEIINNDIRLHRDYLNASKYDIVVSNPPYAKVGCGEINTKKELAISRHEISCTIQDIVEAAFYTLKSNGSLYIIHRADRLADIIYEMRRTGIEPKNIKMIYPGVKKPANLVLLRGIKNGKAELKHEPPLIIYDENGKYTEDIEMIYM